MSSKLTARILKRARSTMKRSCMQWAHFLMGAKLTRTKSNPAWFTKMRMSQLLRFRQSMPWIVTDTGSRQRIEASSSQAIQTRRRRRSTPAMVATFLIHEVLTHDWLSRRPDFVNYAARFHTTTSQLAELATKAKPRLLILYHASIAWRPVVDNQRSRPEVLLSEIISKYSGHVVVARDLDVY